MCDMYAHLAKNTPEGYFINLDVREIFSKVYAAETHDESMLNVNLILKKVEASVKLMDCKSCPLISELIDFK